MGESRINWADIKKHVLHDVDADKVDGLHAFEIGGGGPPQVHGNEAHDPDFLSDESDPTVDASLKGVTKAEVQAHAPQTHEHPESDVTNLVNDLATKETPAGAQAKVDAHKIITTGIHGVGVGTIAKVADIAIDANLSAAAQDAISKKHSQNTDTDLDATFEATFEKVANKGVASGYASLDGTTKVPVAQLGSGTPNGAKFLRDDQSWVTPPGGGESENIARVAGDVSNATTSFADITGLTFAIAANAEYIFEAWLIFQSNTTTTGIKFACNGPASPAAVVMNAHIPIALGLYASDSMLASRAYNTGTASASVDTANANLLCKIERLIRNGANAGTFALRFAAETTGTVKVMAGSILRYRQVA